MNATETVVQRVHRSIRCCVYCGQPLTPAQARKWPGTCNCHSDLPAHDPHYMLSLGPAQR